MWRRGRLSGPGAKGKIRAIAAWLAPRRVPLPGEPLSAVPDFQTGSAAQCEARAQACLVRDLMLQHRREALGLCTLHPGHGPATGWLTETDTLEGDFELDPALLGRILQDHGAPLRAIPPVPAGPPQDSDPSAAQRYLFPPPPSGPPGSAQRLREEGASASFGPGNALANATAVAAGTWHGLAERNIVQRLPQAITDILARKVRQVKLADGVELYDAAQGRQAPRVRLRVRGLPLRVLRQAIPTVGGPATQWRMNGPATSGSLKAQGMTAQRMRNIAVLAGERRLPGALRAASGKVGGGILTFAPSAALDAYDAIETVPGTGDRHFNTHRFLVNQTRNQSANAVGFGAGLVAVALAPAAVAGAPLVLLGLGAGIVAQVVWTWSGAGDTLAGAVDQSLP
jgi:hypothetical protein